jgi:hypothetical protein
VLSNTLLLLACWVCGQNPAIPVLDFATGTLEGWVGEGFSLLRIGAKDSDGTYILSSQDPGPAGKKGLLHRAFVVPPGARAIHFKACAIRTGAELEDGPIDVLLLASGKRVVPKQVSTTAGWQTTLAILPPRKGAADEYRWLVSSYAGQMLRIALVDEDDRPGCHLVCSGFRIVRDDAQDGNKFTQFMVDLAARHHLAPMRPFESAHFTAMSNADEGFSELRLGDCEQMYSFFYDHFRRKGFALQSPAGKLMVAIFDTQAGFDAYLGQKMPVDIIGIYHPGTNRFVMYDFGQNREYITQKQRAERQGREISSLLDRQRYLSSIQRRARDIRSNANTGTIMHEVAHQLSFNFGMLNREGDVPLWAAEGLACYCEVTRNGSWQGIGEPNPERLHELAGLARGEESFIPLRKLVESERWMRIKDAKLFSRHYAESWALFSMLMEERPRALRVYFDLIYSRQTNERRAADFEEAFGTSWAEHDRNFEQYVKRIVRQYGNLK